VSKLRPAFLFSIIVLLESIAATGCERISSHWVEAIVVDSKDAQRNGRDRLLAGEDVGRGSSIQTAASGRADLMLLPNMLLRLERNSDLEIYDLTFSVDGNETNGGVRERAATLRVRRGRLIARLEQHGYNTTSLTFNTARAEIRAKSNSLFEIAENSADTTALCIRGHVDIIPVAAHHVSTLWPGEIMRIEHGGSRHVALDPAEGANSEQRCAAAEVALEYEASAQREARR
jgi:hypothetical protein